MEHMLVSIAAIFSLPLLAFIAYTLDDIARTHRAIAGCLFRLYEGSKGAK